MEVDPTGCGKGVLLPAPTSVAGRRGAVGALEGARERLRRAEAGRVGDLDHRVGGAAEGVGGPLQLEPASEFARRLAERGPDESIEVVPGQVGPSGQVLAAQFTDVEALLDQLEDPVQTTRRDHHRSIVAHGGGAVLTALAVFAIGSRSPAALPAVTG